tara:strand:+ start:1242 stop:1451 length:210 start_codon:yes stop_codon:yes gene_type:complete
MDKKYIAATIALPAETVETLDEIRTYLEAKTGISKLSRRQVIESLISHRMETLYNISRSEVDALGDADE